MYRYIKPALVGLGMLMFSMSAIAQVRPPDTPDVDCVLTCLREQQNRIQNRTQCTAADRLECQRDCKVAPPQAVVFGDQVGNIIYEDPAKTQGRIDTYARSIGLTNNQSAETYLVADTALTKPENNPFGLDIPIKIFLQFLPFGLPDIFGDDTTQWVVTSGSIPCMQSKSVPGGLGCLELPKLGATGWAVNGCGNPDNPSGPAGLFDSACCMRDRSGKKQGDAGFDAASVGTGKCYVAPLNTATGNKIAGDGIW